MACSNRSVLTVALCEEGVDRNVQHGLRLVVQLAVALCEEGVDRNWEALQALRAQVPSPSAKRAWIEMHAVFDGLYWMPRSPSAKRAWIEISWTRESPGQKAVALCEEGVDRNNYEHLR